MDFVAQFKVISAFLFNLIRFKFLLVLVVNTIFSERISLRI